MADHETYEKGLNMGWLKKKLGKKLSRKLGKAVLGFAGGFVTTGGNWFSSSVGAATAVSRKGPATLKNSALTGAVAGFGTSVVLGGLGLGMSGTGILGKTAGLYTNYGMKAGGVVSSAISSLWNKAEGAQIQGPMQPGGDLDAGVVGRALRGSGAEGLDVRRVLQSARLGGKPDSSGILPLALIAGVAYIATQEG